MILTILAKNYQKWKNVIFSNFKIHISNLNVEMDGLYMIVKILRFLFSKILESMTKILEITTKAIFHVENGGALPNFKIFQSRTPKFLKTI